MNTRNGNRKGKRLLAIVLTLIMLLTVALPAAGTGVTDSAITANDSEAVGAETPEGSDSNASEASDESKIGGGRTII
jgi:hypothetical protein